MSDRDYYEILGLTPRADGAMVDQAYWHLARKYQGLAATNVRAQYLLDELNEAYGVLGNPRLREQYDAFRDDVLLRQGMIRPVRSKPLDKKHADKAAAPKAAHSLALPKDAPIYGLAGLMAVLALAGMWQGVSVMIAGPALAAGLGLILVPFAKRRIDSASLSMPSMPSMNMPAVNMPAMPTIQAPKLQAPKLSMPSLSDAPLVGARDEGGIDADTLRASTAATIARWRKSVGLKHIDTSLGAPMDGPDHTLVDIVQSEREVEESSEPLNAVLDILRGSSRPANTV